MARKRTAKTAPTIPTTRAVASAADAPPEAAVGAAAKAAADAPAGQRATVIAHLVTGEDIKSALISSDDELDVEFEGDDPRDQRATVTTDEGGVLTWALVLETAFSNAAWRLTLTRRGSAEGPPDADGITDAQGRAVRSDLKPF